MRAVGLDPRGLTLQDRQGRTGHLPRQKVGGLSVACIGRPEAAEEQADSLILDLIIGPRGTPPDGPIRCIRLSSADLAIPQLQGEPSLGLHGYPAFPDLAAYEADLLTRLSTDP